MKLGVRFTLLLFGAGLAALLVAGAMQQSRLQRHFERDFHVQAALLTDELEGEFRLLTHPATRATLPLVLAMGRKRLQAKAITIFDAQGRPMAASVDESSQSGLSLVYTRNIHQGSILLGRVVVEGGTYKQPIHLLTRMTVGTMLFALFVAWLLAEMALHIAIANPLYKLMTRLKKVAAGRISIEELKGNKGDELAEIGNLVAQIIKEEQKQAAKVHHLPLTNRQVSSGIRN